MIILLFGNIHCCHEEKIRNIDDQSSHNQKMQGRKYFFLLLHWSTISFFFDFFSQKICEIGSKKSERVKKCEKVIALVRKKPSHEVIKVIFRWSVVIGSNFRKE